MTRFAAGIVVVALCAGCELPGERAARSGYETLLGRPILEVISALGPPHEQQVIEGQTWYSWSTKYLESPLVANQSSYELQCRLSTRVIDGLVAERRAIGNRGACITLAAPLGR